ncbi:ribonuclease H-like domain-containing protein [Mycena metata]|uniref:Ribonuclease H-like domain-containing protein n=1 Tax=Mycena metata TaxID=1033252 RepID=A0AAD7MFZ0_9AGAR|nr:ribonuclease H-like domain-containing protein [Mycena metata]
MEHLTSPKTPAMTFSSPFEDLEDHSSELQPSTTADDLPQTTEEPPPAHEPGLAPAMSREHSTEPDSEEEDDGPALTDADVVQGHLNVATVTYITTEEQANDELANITEGVVGFDTEFVKRELYGDEAIIDAMSAMGASAKKTARTAIQYLESKAATFAIRWSHTGLCLVQIAQGDKVWVLNMNRVRAFPSELRRIIESPSILLAGAGILSDGCVIWEDLRCDAKSLVDVGLMTRLWRVDKHKEEPFGNLALEVAMREALGIEIDKTFQKTVDWKREPNKAHILYAAIDAAASLRLYEELVLDMAEEAANPETTFSTDWYTFNCTIGEAMRVRRSVRGAEVPWSTRDCTWYANNKFQGKYY